jgi:hypothetical protein
MENEKDSIADHHESQVDNIKNELTVQLLSFAGLTIAFGIGVMRTWQMVRGSQDKIRKLN